MFGNWQIDALCDSIEKLVAGPTNKYTTVRRVCYVSMDALAWYEACVSDTLLSDGEARKPYLGLYSHISCDAREIACKAL